MSSAILYIDANGNWNIGQLGQPVSAYKQVTSDGKPVNDDTFELTAVTVEVDGAGFVIYAQSNQDLSQFAEIKISATLQIQSKQSLSQREFYAVETRYQTDLNENGGIGDQLVLVDDGQNDLYVDGSGAYLIKTAKGALIPLTFDGEPITIYTLEDYEFEEIFIEEDGSITIYAQDADQEVVKLKSSPSGVTSSAPQPVSAEELAALESSSGVDLNGKFDLPLTVGWTAALKTQVLRAEVESQLASAGRINHTGLLKLIQVVTTALEASRVERIGDDLVSDLKSIASRGKTLFSSQDLTGNETTYLAYVFDKLVNGSKANQFFTGGQTKTQSLGNLSGESTLTQLGLLRDKWLLGRDLPDPRTEGDTANASAAAASGVYKTFDAALFAGDASAFDVNQGSAGTCYLLAALAGIANSSPSALKTVFSSGVTSGANRVWGVRFFDTTGNEVWVSVNDQLVVSDPAQNEASYAKALGRDATGAVVPELWVPLLEKAYAQANELGAFGREVNKNQMFAIEGGLAEPVANLLGGSVSQLSDTTSTAVNGNPLLNKIDATDGGDLTSLVLKAINGGQIVFVASFNTTNEAVTNEILWTEKHAFAAFDPEPLNPNNSTIQIYNPWGYSTKLQQNNPSNPYLSPFVIEASEVTNKSGFFFFTRALGGSASDDVVFGSDKSDGFDGSSGDDLLKGLVGDDTLLGSTGRDTLLGGAGDDILDGGADLDIASYAKTTSAFKLSLGANKVSLSDQSGSEGTDTLINIERLQFADKTIRIDTKSHVSYADLPDTLYQFFVVGFGAAPGVTYMDQMAEAYRYWLPQYKDGTVKQIVEAFTTKSQFTSVYPQALYRTEGGKYYAYAHDASLAGNPLVRGAEVSKAVFDTQMASLAQGLVATIVKTSASEATKGAAAADIQAALGLGGDWTIGKVIYTVFGNLASKPLSDPTWGGTAKQFANQVAVAKYYTDTLSQSTDDVTTLRSVMAAVTNTTDVSNTDAIASLIGVALLNGPGG
jgi:hypothetical protein